MLQIYPSQRTPSTDGDDDVFTPPKKSQSQSDKISSLIKYATQSLGDSSSGPQSTSSQQDLDSEIVKLESSTPTTKRPQSLTAKSSSKLPDIRSTSNLPTTAVSDVQLSAKSSTNTKVPAIVSAQASLDSVSSLSSPLVYSDATSASIDGRLSTECFSARESMSDTLADTEYFTVSEDLTDMPSVAETDTKTEVESPTETGALSSDAESGSETGSLLEQDDGQQTSSSLVSKSAELHIAQTFASSKENDYQQESNTSGRVNKISTVSSSDVAGVSSLTVTDSDNPKNFPPIIDSTEHKSVFDAASTSSKKDKVTETAESEKKKSDGPPYLTEL